ncbi:MAG: ABC transporter ATP-binding protein, partial [Candidatus Peribacteraceae bacterium]|nr:ABC transporter ATP-binding protein [Candidatus Peribacteraceae bacterium]
MTLAVLRTLWHLLRDFHGRIYRLTGYIAVYELLKLVPAGVLALVIDTVIMFDASKLPFLLVMLVVLFVASMIVSMIDIHIAYESSVIDFESGASLLRQVAEKLLRLPIGYHEQYNTGRTVHTLHRGVDRLGELIFFTGREVVPTLLQLILTTIILFWIGLIPALVFIAFLPVFFLIIHRYGKRVQPIRQEYHEQMTAAAGHIGERIMNIRTVQDYAMETRELGRYSSILGDFVRLGKKRMDYHRSYFLVRDTVMNIARVVIMGTGIWLVAHGSMTPGVLVFFITLTEKANLSLFRISSVYDRAGDSAEGISAMVRLFEEEEAITEKPDAIPVTTLEGRIHFRDVTFAYVKGKTILEHVTFDVPPKTMLENRFAFHIRERHIAE